MWNAIVKISSQKKREQSSCLALFYEAVYSGVDSDKISILDIELLVFSPSIAGRTERNDVPSVVRPHLLHVRSDLCRGIAAVT